MKASYYYLVAGLPDLLLDEGRGPPPIGELADEIGEQLTDSDRELLRFVRFSFDNSNVVRLLGDRARPFDARGNWGEEELAEAVKKRDGLPQYLEAFLDEHAAGRSLSPGLSAEDNLAWLYYEEAFGSANEFVREWFGFEADLRNLCAALACRAAAERDGEDLRGLLAGAVVTRNEAAEQILRSNAPDFGLAATLPWVERAIRLRREGMVASEKGLDNLRWDMLGQITALAHFQVDTVLAFFVKLTIAHRWRGLDAAEGKALLEKLTAELAATPAVAAAA
jgi:hypothetical protein